MADLLSSRMGLTLCIRFSRCPLCFKVPGLENQFLFALSFFHHQTNCSGGCAARGETVSGSQFSNFDRVTWPASPYLSRVGWLVSHDPHCTSHGATFHRVHKDGSRLGSPLEELNLCRVQTDKSSAQWQTWELSWGQELRRHPGARAVFNKQVSKHCQGAQIALRTAAEVEHLERGQEQRRNYFLNREPSQ